MKTVIISLLCNIKWTLVLYIELWTLFLYSQGFIMASPQLTSNTEFIGSPGNSLPLVTGKIEIICF